MANPEHLERLREGVDAWNTWRNEHRGVVPDLSGATLVGANLWEANLMEANLTGGNLVGASLTAADLTGANLSRANFEGTRLNQAKLEQTLLVQTNFRNADFTDSQIYGISAWDLDLDGTIQANLLITPRGQPEVRVDNLQGLAGYGERRRHPRSAGEGVMTRLVPCPACGAVFKVAQNEVLTDPWRDRCPLCGPVAREASSATFCEGCGRSLRDDRLLFCARCIGRVFERLSPGGWLVGRDPSGGAAARRRNRRCHETDGAGRLHRTHGTAHASAPPLRS